MFNKSHQISSIYEALRTILTSVSSYRPLEQSLKIHDFFWKRYRYNFPACLLPLYLMFTLLFHCSPSLTLQVQHLFIPKAG